MWNIELQENEFWKNESKIADLYPGSALIGIDEAGRGSLAGPVTASAVCYLKAKKFPLVKDSKKLSQKRREHLYIDIKESGAFVVSSFISASLIDKINILNATKMAMRKCIDQMLNIVKKHTLCSPVFLIDGNQRISNELRGQQITIIKGDNKIASIASASIVAKVERDSFMCNMDVVFPGYEFSVHKGYGTKKHRQLLKENGITPFHRRTFVRKII